MRPPLSCILNLEWCSHHTLVFSLLIYCGIQSMAVRRFFNTGMCNWPCGRLVSYHHLITFHHFYCWNVSSPDARGMRFSKTMHLTPPSDRKSQNMLILFNIYSLKIYTLLVNPHFKCLLLPHIYSPFNAITLPAQVLTCVNVCYTQIEEAHEVQLVTMGNNTHRTSEVMYIYSSGDHTRLKTPVSKQR